MAGGVHGWGSGGDEGVLRGGGGLIGRIRSATCTGTGGGSFARAVDHGPLGVYPFGSRGKENNADWLMSVITVAWGSVG